MRRVISKRHKLSNFCPYYPCRSEISLPDTFWQARHLESHGYRQMLIQEVFEQVQAELEKAQVTAVSTMNNLHPIVPLGDYAQIDDPDVGRASCDHQTGQAHRVRDVAFVQVEPPAFPVGEEGLATLHKSEEFQSWDHNFAQNSRVSIRSCKDVGFLFAPRWTLTIDYGRMG